MTTIDTDLVPLVEAINERWRAAQPSAFYVPSRPSPERPYAFQEAFHKATHELRAVFPGNRSGKTRAGSVEADWWLQGTHPYQPTPRPPIQAWWTAPKYDQFEALREQLHTTAFRRGWEWNGQKHVYTWPNRSTLTIISGDSDWRDIQGPNPAIIFIDEQCPLPLWREMRARGFGRYKTRYVVMATATQADSWMEDEIYQPWLAHHRALGLDEEGAMRTQSHPSIWCWPRGGIQDNPIMGEEDVVRFRALRWSHEKEFRVRNQGGFENWTGDAVFDGAAMDWMEERARTMDRLHGGGRNGSPVIVPPGRAPSWRDG